MKLNHIFYAIRVFKMSLDNRCVEQTTRKERCKHNKVEGDLCLRHHNLKKNKKLLTHNGPTKECSNAKHGLSNSRYSRTNVPLENFRKSDGSDNDLYSTCIDCRTYHKNLRNGIENIKIEFDDEPEEDIEKDRCSQITTKNRRCRRDVYIENLCKFHHNLKLKEQGKFIIIIPNDEAETRECNSPYHKSYGSIYPKDKVPVEKFRKGGEEEFYKLCEECRNYGNRMVINRKNKILEIKPSCENLKVCRSIHHTINGVSIYPRDSVPLFMFAFKSKDSNEESNYCMNCREYHYIKNRKYREKIKINAEGVGKFFCNMCHNTLELKYRSYDKNGSPNTFCLDCQVLKKHYSGNHSELMRNAIRDIQLDFMNKNEASCERCKSIFIKPDNNIKCVTELETYEKDDCRYVKYNEEEHLVTDFLIQYDDILEFRILEFDHLDENEQRERGIIKEGEKFIEKRGGVTTMKTIYDMKKESEITQLLCCKCHLIVTISREKGTLKHGKEVIKRSEYTDKLKNESGCEICKFNDSNLLRYLEFDHLEPILKICNVSEMVRNITYTFEDLINECKKCRILCRSCHKIHTYEQRQRGVI